jgi:transcriptional regulator with XRE-family HTH domain
VRRSGDRDEIVRLYRHERLTQAQIALRCGISQSTVARRLRDPIATSGTRRPGLAAIPDAIRPEDRRKLEYVRQELTCGRRDDQDAAFLTGVYRDILRRYRPSEAQETGGAPNRPDDRGREAQMDLFTVEGLR